MKVQEMCDRIELKELVDLFSNYSDTKENDKQVKLFTEDGKVIIINDEKITFTLQGREEIFEAFSSSMEDYKSVFHMSGQQTVEFVDENHANGTAYNLVVLVKENEDGSLMTTQEGVRYEDNYEKVNDKWLIAERNSHFNWHLDK